MTRNGGSWHMLYNQSEVYGNRRQIRIAIVGADLLSLQGLNDYER